MKSVHSDRYKSLLSALVAARKAAKLTQAELAGFLGKPQSFVSKYESGERRLDVEEFLEVCELVDADAIKMLQQLKGQGG